MMESIVRNNSIESTDADRPARGVEVRSQYESPTLSIVDLADVLLGNPGSGTDSFGTQN